MKTIIAVIFLVFSIIIGLTAIDTGKAYLDKQLGLTSQDNSNSIALSNSEEIAEIVKVTLHGEVQSPGTYEIENGIFLQEALEKAGGITSLADESCFDYYYCINEDMAIYIAPISNEDKISINTASMEELMQLTGIGKTLAERIIKYREETTKFNCLEELMKVEGIGKSIFNKIRDTICL